MNILDTNVISAVMRPHRNAEIRHWLDVQPTASLWTTTVSIYEIVASLGTLPEGQRKRMLEKAFAASIETLFEARILPFDVEAAEHAGAILSRRLLAGTNKETRDTQIAGIVMSRRATLATRNVKDFSDLDIALVNPWTP
ncbi:type II toxin-antitoxin system VapC family toxin [Mesorhizobium sp. CAU 1732]|uniref:type II toxin-antitoxin system VapC family toxin n=1 Tax=Mesorhizobium sp. CAU 1732 TaxID=3140358 RepID=UPI003260B8E4